MRGVCVLGALLVVLVANGWAVWQATQNRSQPSGGTLQLTERELPLQPVALESTVTVLRLNWNTRRAGDQRFGPAAWLHEAKLAELGFDCSVPLTSAKARRHYSAMAPRRVFLALEYKADAAQDGLLVVDADQDPNRLLQLYPDRAKHAICRGIIRLSFRSHDPDGRPLSAPRLEAWVAQLLPPQVFVPRPANRALSSFLRNVSAEKNTPPGDPRYSAMVHWGKNYEPWVDDVHPVGGSSTNR